MIDRRQLLKTASLGAGGAALGSAMPSWASGKHGGALARKGSDVLSGEQLTMTVRDAAYTSGKRHGPAVSVNGTIPGPLLRLREGQLLTVDLVNASSEDTSIHWHGLLVPFLMDGVPGVTQLPVRPGERFRYQFPVRQAGTYWWHAHTMQEPMGHYGPIIIDPAGHDHHGHAERDYVVMLSDWSPLHPHVIMKRLKVGHEPFNYAKTALNDTYPLGAEERRMWARMRMAPSDIADVTGSTYTYLLNGHGPGDGLEFAFTPGERVRLRFINGSAMTFFNLRIPGLAMRVIAADGQNVAPVEVDEFQIGNAETYDVIIEPKGAEAFAIVAEAMDRSGMGLAMLTSRPGARAAVPALREVPLLTMADMGMDHSAHAGHGGGAMKMRDTARLPYSVKTGPGLDMVSANPVDRMGDPGIGLGDAGHRVLTYKQLIATSPNPDAGRPSRSLQIHLTGNMRRYMWSFDGRKFSAVTDHPIRFALNERVRVKLVNDTMMAHPIHLHGHFFELVNGAPDGLQPRKHTMIVQPGGSAQFDFTADAPGDWAFHCHLIYHMHAGMMQVVTVRPLPEDGA